MINSSLFYCLLVLPNDPIDGEGLASELGFFIKKWANNNLIESGSDHEEDKNTFY